MLPFHLLLYSLAYFHLVASIPLPNYYNPHLRSIQKRDVNINFQRVDNIPDIPAGTTAQNLITDGQNWASGELASAAIAYLSDPQRQFGVEWTTFFGNLQGNDREQLRQAVLRTPTL